MDRISRAHRSWNMSRIRAKDTVPELLVRSALHRLGYRFRLHKNDLPGRPDIVLPRWKVAIFVHGCFWHRHPNCKYAYTPQSKVGFWNRKFAQNVTRDRRKLRALKASGWKVVVLWECKVTSVGLSNILSRRLHVIRATRNSASNCERPQGRSGLGR